MSALQLVEDEGLHLLLRDLPRLDVGPDLLGRELRVAGAEGDVHDPDRIRRMGEQLDVDGGIHPGPSYSATPQHLVSRLAFLHNLWKSWGERIMTEMPVTVADFNLQGRVDNYRELLLHLFVSLYALVQGRQEEGTHG